MDEAGYLPTSTKSELEKKDILLNNAGLARGTEHVVDVVSETDWRVMMETNVMGLLRMTHLAIPHLIANVGR